PHTRPSSSFSSSPARRALPSFPTRRSSDLRRVVIHEHLGIGATVASIRTLLGAVPNLELLEIEQDSGFSYACGGQAAKFKERERSGEHTSELQSLTHIVCRLLLVKKKKTTP